MSDKATWTLVAIDFAADKGLTPAQLQKSLFLLQKAYGKNLKDFYEFTPYNYGPFDKHIYDDADLLAIKGYVKRKTEDTNQRWSKYFITKAGQDKVKALEKELEPKASKYLRNVVEWAQKLTFQQLISTIYQHFPEYKVNSVFREQ